MRHSDLLNAAADCLEQLAKTGTNWTPSPEEMAGACRVAAKRAMARSNRQLTRRNRACKRTVEIATGHPAGWPACPGCGRPALDGHITCGNAACAEGDRRRGGSTV